MERRTIVDSPAPQPGPGPGPAPAPARIIPTIGRIVLVCLSAAMAEQINRRRTTGADIAARIKDKAWPEGAQAHIGNTANEGDVLPAIVVAVHSEDCINARVFLDGTDEYWCTSIASSEGPEPGKFHWMPYQIGQAKRHAAEAR